MEPKAIFFLVAPKSSPLYKKPMKTRLAPVYYSMLLAFAGFTLWTFNDALVHGLAAYSPLLIACVANAFSLLFLCVMAPKLGGFRETFTRPRLKLRLFRGLLLTISNILSFYVFVHLDLAKAYAIIFLVPLMAKVLSVIITREKIKPAAWAISLAGFAGVLIVLRPGWVPLDTGSLAALGLTFVFALGYVLSRFIGEENQTPLSMALFQYFFSSLATIIPAWYALQSASLTPAAFLVMAAIGTTSAYGSILVARAFASAPSAIIAPIHYTQILWGTLFGAVFFSEYPDKFTVLGGLVIILAGLALLRFNSVASKNKG